jgi:hypothetical protein
MYISNQSLLSFLLDLGLPDAFIQKIMSRKLYVQFFFPILSTCPAHSSFVLSGKNVLDIRCKENATSAVFVQYTSSSNLAVFETNKVIFVPYLPMNSVRAFDKISHWMSLHKFV